MTKPSDNKSTQVVDEAMLRAFAKGQLGEVEEVQVLALLEKNPKLQANVAAISIAPIVQKMQAHSQVIREKSLSSQVAAGGQPAEPSDQSGTIDIPDELSELNEYTIVRELGRGGMGIAYLARHNVTERLEVLKVLSEKFVADADAKDRFLQEVKVTSALDHPAIVQSYTVRITEETYCLRDGVCRG